MFTIVKNKEFFEFIWNKIISDEIINHEELNFEYLEALNPETILKEDLHLFFLHEREGIIGKVSLSHTNRLLNLSIADKLPHLGLILKDIEYHINGESPIHEETDTFEEITHNFYQYVLSTALSVSHDLHFVSIITISDHIDDHDDLTYWGDFNFSTVWETKDSVVGILNNHDQLKDTNRFNHNIKLVSNIMIH